MKKGENVYKLLEDEDENGKKSSDHMSDCANLLGPDVVSKSKLSDWLETTQFDSTPFDDLDAELELDDDEIDVCILRGTQGCIARTNR